MNKINFIYIILFSLLTSIFIYVMNFSMKKDFQMIAEQNLKSMETAYSSIFDIYSVAAQKDFKYLMKSKKILELLKDFKYSNNEEKKILRAYLFRELFNEYENLKSTGVRQFHFHTHDGKSLLRFHNLPKNGDSLFEIRNSIRFANIQKNSSFGFEGGRVFPGFRYVFPIIYDKEHLGSVEFSLAFEAFEERLNTVLPAYAYVLIMNKKTTVDKAFESHKEYFEKSNLSNDFYIENEKISKISKKIKNDLIINNLNKKLLKLNDFNTKLTLNHNFSIPVIDKNSGYIISFIAIYDTNNKFSSYIVSYKKQPDLILIKSKYTISTILGSLAILLFIYVLSIAIKQRYKTLKQKKDLEESHKNLQTILDYQNNIIIIYEDNKIKQVNKSFLTYFNIESIDEFNYKYSKISDLFVEENSANQFDKKSFIKSLKNKDIEIFNNSTVKLISENKYNDNIFLMHIDFYRENGYIIVLTNINELIELQNIINTQSKVAAVGEMIGNIAHQWRQPLSAISVDITGLKLQIEYFDKIEKDDVINCLDRVNENTMYLSKTIDDFRDFFKDDTQKISEFNIKDLIEKVYNLTKDTLRHNHIEVIFDVEDVEISHNENVFLQALLNILNNSKDAFVDNNIEGKRYLFIEVKKDLNKANINIYDNANGIDEKIIDKVFEPYFTTKHQSIGTGIGLYMTHQIITKQLNGEIKVKNYPFKYKEKDCIGARFEIIIPLVK